MFLEVEEVLGNVCRPPRGLNKFCEIHRVMCLCQKVGFFSNRPRLLKCAFLKTASMSWGKWLNDVMSSARLNRKALFKLHNCGIFAAGSYRSVLMLERFASSRIVWSKPIY